MIQKETIVEIIDNSGAKKALCIHMYKGYKRRYSRMGDLIKVAIKKVRKKNPETLKIKKGDMSRAVVTTCKTPLKTFSNELKFYKTNSVVLISDQNKYLASKVNVKLDYSFFRYTRYSKLLRMSSKRLKP
jgi:large subunit ribosomal protein L14